ncbi:MAG TPA: VCBS repeat-containing protein [Chryseolinea sp.]
MIRVPFYECTKIFIGSVVISLCSCKEDPAHQTFFHEVPASHSNIKFENILSYSDDFNIIEYLYYYNGGGVALGDINNDGLADVYFSSNQHSNKLYLNKGGFEFEDITSTAGVAGVGNWKTGVTMADVNADGLLDIFVCGVGKYKHFDGRNQLFINNGNLTFTDRTEEYGLLFEGFSTQSLFFDYDNDGDLDMYLANHSVHTSRSYGHSTLRYQHDPLSGDKLYQNEFNQTGKHHFREVTSAAGIYSSQIGYALAVSASDLNRDGYTDIYVCNDFHENDYLYLNQGNGTFKQVLERSLPHSSRFSMGCDIADINNDGLTDILTLDMLPKDEQVIKTTAGEDAYEIYDFKLRYGYHYQFARNTLQLNRGIDTNGDLMFSDIAPYANVEATDWSWAALAADFDNDGYKDFFVANGIVGRPNDLDYINYISTDSAQRYYTDKQLIDQMPSGKVSNVFFQNKGDLTFDDVTASWIGSKPTLSNGAAYGDLDNDGDLDLIVNNINENALVYRNELPRGSFHFLKIKFEGKGANPFGIGASVTAYAGQKTLYNEQFQTRGWLSSVDHVMHIGLGEEDHIDSLVIRWPDQTTQILKPDQVDQTIVVQQSAASMTGRTEVKPEVLLKESEDVAFVHDENDFVAFNVERLIPHMLSTQGPKIAVADVNADKLEDFFVGGAAGQPSGLFVQDRKAKFIKVRSRDIEADSAAEDTGSVFFDADGNGSTDLIVVAGGGQADDGAKELQPRLYLNDGMGTLKKAPGRLPEIYINASCVKPADIDNDGDTDLFIGARVVAGKYGVDPQSYLLINDGRGTFTNVSSRLPNKGRLGMVTDAVWTDLNNDNRQDMLLTGEWMPVTLLIQNNSDEFIDSTNAGGLKNTNGWWNTIEQSDFDKDGDPDFVVGNFGLNSRLRAGVKQPVSIFIGDIDNNNSLDQMMTYYNSGVSYPFISRDQLIKQVPSLKRKFLKFDNYRNVSINDILSSEAIEKFSRKDAFSFASVHLENRGDGTFLIKALPAEAQLFPLFALCVDDVDGDGNKDVIATGNLNAVQPDVGRYDAGYGIVLRGDGKGNFQAMTSQQSGLVVRGEGRDVKSLVTSGNKKVFLISRNNNSVKVFQQNKTAVK